MIELEIAIAIAAVVLLLIIILIILKVRKRISKKAKPEMNFKTPVLAKQSQGIKSGVEPVFKTEPQGEHSAEMQTDEPVFDPVTSIAPQTDETVIPPPENKYKNLPQDSVLRRHYLTNLHAMIESLKFPRPTDSALSRHYDAMIIAEMEQCLRDEAAMERLVCNYEEHKKTLARQIRKPEAVPEPLIEPIKAGINQQKLKLPEDSMLRRHYLTHLRALIEFGKPARPTDFTLRRHYDSMIENELNNLLFSE